MSISDINACEDAEMAECDGEKVVTMMDVLQEQEDFEEDANAVLGASDEKNCTYSKGPIKRQAVYACMTCCADAKGDPSKRAGLCLACSLSCHENHELIELYTKRNFRCDCGNPKFNSHPCQFTPNKTEVNEENIYNQNFSGLYCICHRPYPDPETTVQQEMIQCIICEDWLHSSHLDTFVPPNEQYTEMICKACMDQNEFLHDYSDFAVNKNNVDVDILNCSSEYNDSTKCNGILNTETAVEPDMENNTNPEKKNVTDASDELKQCDTEMQAVKENIHEDCSDDQTKAEKEVQNITETFKNYVTPEVKNTTEDQYSARQNVAGNDNGQITSDEDLKTNEQTQGTDTNCDKIVSESEHKLDEQNDKTISTTETACEKKITETEQENNEHTEETEPLTETTCNKVVFETEQKDNDQNKNTSTEVSSDKVVSEPEQKTNEQTEESKPSPETSCDKSISETIQVINAKDQKINATELVCEKDISETEQTKEINPSMNTQETSDETNAEQSSLNDKKTMSVIKSETLDKRSQEQVEEDLLLADPVDTVQGKSKDIDYAAPSISNIKTDEVVDPQIMDTSDSMVVIAENKEETLQNGTEPVSVTEQSKRNDIQTDDNVRNENSADVVMNENPTDNTENKDIENDIKTSLNSSNELIEKSAAGADILKRKHIVEADNDNSEVKKQKLDKTQCTRPKGVKRVHQGATFWPSNFRHKLCTCNECITMYKDLSVLFLIDQDDTMTAYERLGKEKTDGKPVSQYEKGMAALSSLGRVQQINALTEYAKMRDKLLEFLKSFKDRKVIVKEEDIKAFFAGMKPVREPDGVYFCR